MNDQPDNAFLRRSQRLYGWLLAAYPKHYREAYGPAMQQVFRDQCRDAWREARGWGLAMLWLRVLPDLLKTSFVERLSIIQGDSMSHRFARILGFQSNPRVLFLRTAVGVFVLIFGATAITTLLMPKRYTSEARLFVRYLITNNETSAAGKTPSAERRARGKRILDGEIQRIHSDAVLERVVKAQDLETKWANTLAKDQKLTTGEAVAMLRNRLKVHNPPGSPMIHFRVNSEDADEATLLAKAVVDAYLATHFKEAQLSRTDNSDRAAMAEQRRTERLRELPAVTSLSIIQSPTPGDSLVRPNVPGCLLMAGAGGLFLALMLGVTVTLLACRRQARDASPVSAGNVGV